MIDRIAHFIAAILPRRIVYFAGLRMLDDVSSRERIGAYTSMTAFEMLEAWYPQGSPEEKGKIQPHRVRKS